MEIPPHELGTSPTFCSKCSNEITAGNNFCRKCGNKIEITEKINAAFNQLNKEDNAIKNKINELLMDDKNQEAIQYCDTAIRRGLSIPDKCNVLYSKGMALFSLRRYQEAEKQFDSVLEFYPENTDALCQKGACIMFHSDDAENPKEPIENYKNALSYMVQVLKLDPNHEVALRRKTSIMWVLDTN